MRITHKRKVQQKFKRNAITTSTIKKEKKVVVAKKETAKKVEKKVVKKAPTASVAAKKSVDVALTPKQQSIFDIVAKSKDGITSKEIGLAANQEEAKASAWATSGIKKLLEENLVVREALGGNKVIYKLA